MAIHGVADRNIECWICADPQYVAHALGVRVQELLVSDPKGRFESALGIGGGDLKENEITRLVRDAPLHAWLQKPSFEDFYEQVRDVGQRRGCQIENLRDSTAS